MYRKSSFCSLGDCVEVEMDWHRSSFCSDGMCVEVTWHRSGFCSAAGNCVEVTGEVGEIKVRDSKNPDGPVLSFDNREWAAFIQGAKAGEFDAFLPKATS